MKDVERFQELWSKLMSPVGLTIDETNEYNELGCSLDIESDEHFFTDEHLN